MILFCALWDRWRTSPQETCSCCQSLCQKMFRNTAQHGYCKSWTWRVQYWQLILLVVFWLSFVHRDIGGYKHANKMSGAVFSGKFHCMSWGTCFSEPNLEDFLNNLYSQSSGSAPGAAEGGYSDQGRHRRKGKRKKWLELLG